MGAGLNFQLKLKYYFISTISLIFLLAPILNATANDCDFALKNMTITFYLSGLKKLKEAQKNYEQSRKNIDLVALELGMHSREYKRAVQDWERAESEFKAAKNLNKTHIRWFIDDVATKLKGKTITVEASTDREFFQGKVVNFNDFDTGQITIETPQGTKALNLDIIDWESLQVI